tara:strand:+ start:969 stop:1190 length:222 start_codon:yes stop_codon:yes gene_type:complete
LGILPTIPYKSTTIDVEFGDLLLLTEMSTEELVNMLINDFMGYTVDCEQDDDLKMDFSDDSGLEEVSIAFGNG